MAYASNVGIRSRTPNGSAGGMSIAYRDLLEDSPLARTLAHLDELGIGYKVFDHEPRFTAADEANACGVAASQAAKSIALRDARDHRLLAVIPASERLDLARLRHELGSTSLRMATEEELGAEFPQLELGAIPPFASMLGVAAVIDERLLEGRRILCNGGDHSHSLLVDPVELVSLAGGRIGEICKVRRGDIAHPPHEASA